MIRFSLSKASRKGERRKEKGENNSHLSSLISHLTTPRSGYIFLITILFVSAVAVSVLGSYLLLSIASMENGVTFQASSQALENAQTCAERGLMSLFLDNGYTGDESITLTNGTCEILNTGGFGNENRTLCTEGIFGAHTRRMELVIVRLLPSIQIYSWQEVASISSCEY